MAIEGRQSEVELLKPADVAALLKISQQTLANWRWLGEGPKFVKVGKLIRYREIDLAAWLSKTAA